MKSDPLLETIVAAALTVERSFEGRAPIRITLFVGGVVISGQIVTARDFMLADQFTDIITEMADKKRQVLGAPKLDSESLDAGFIHLKNASFWSGGKSIALPQDENAMFWRGKIEPVDGYVLGALVVTAKATE